MRTNRVYVAPYDASWPLEFIRVRARIDAALRGAGFPYAVHHVGSTSVPGLAAKPILDIDVEIPDMDRFEETARRLEQAGYVREGDLGIPLREAFAYVGGDRSMAHHLYVCPTGGAELRRHIAFRDRLIAHAEDAQAYAEAKIRAARAHPSDIDGYMLEKSSVIERIYKSAGIDRIKEQNEEEGNDTMIRQTAFIDANRMLKGALHCHTTRSDGKGDPKDVMLLHKEHGYDFMALTDHRFYNYASYAPETGITVIPGMEMDGNLPEEGVHCFHEVCIGPSREDGNGFEQDQRFESVRINDQSEFQPTLDWLHANNNMTIYCHPEWSGTPAREFENLKGNFAMELWNSGCAIENELDTNNGALWDELLMRGVRLWGVATDDGHKMSQHCKGWVMVNAKNDVNSILAALRDGAFYASTGPEIYDFRVEDDKAVLECSPCSHIAFHYGRMPLSRVQNEDGSPVSHGETRLRSHMTYVRATVVDKLGRRAWTNPIYLDK